MSKTLPVVLVAAVMVILIIALDVLFFRHQFWPRLAANVGIVLLAGAFYFRFRGLL